MAEERGHGYGGGHAGATAGVIASTVVFLIWAAFGLMVGGGILEAVFH